MAEPAIGYSYRYAGESSLALTDGSAALRLATSGGAVANPRLFSGRVLDPVLFADELLTIGAIARARFHVPPAMLEQILLLADPVATAAQDRLRFEAFSSCCSVYGRVDILPGSIDGDLFGAGTTNVDLGPGIRAALAGVQSGAAMSLDIGLKTIAVGVNEATHTERKVALPRRWLRGFMEVQAIQAGMRPRFHVDGAGARRFLRSLPRSATRPVFVRQPSGDLTLGHRASSADVAVAGPERLRLLECLAPRATGLGVWSAADGSTAWCLELPHSRLTLVLSPEAWRGFSGEGRTLEQLADAGGHARLAEQVRARLAWQSRLSVGDLARDLGVDQGAVAAALAALASSGIVGFDLADGAYFHRVLPFSVGQVERVAPRLRRARQLIAAGAVTFEPDDGPDRVAWVKGRNAEYRVRFGPGGQACTCPWWGKRGGERGPCAHVLAAQILLDSAVPATEVAAEDRLDA